ncbi:MAG: CBS domain-containing protein [Saccharofermentans sp.]|nr:CBS domain-containing protein [Saccharofermentans sp.]
MNIAFFLIPKAETAFLYDDYTVRQALEKMHHHGYSAIPVLNREGEYVGTLSEGDLLWFIVKGEGGEPHTKAIELLEKDYIRDIDLNKEYSSNPAVNIMASIDELLMRAMNQNFIPIVDDRGMYIGIVTRRSVIKYFYDNTMDKKLLE